MGAEAALPGRDPHHGGRRHGGGEACLQGGGTQDPRAEGVIRRCETVKQRDVLKLFMRRLDFMTISRTSETTMVKSSRTSLYFASLYFGASLRITDGNGGAGWPRGP